MSKEFSEKIDSVNEDEVYRSRYRVEMYAERNTRKSEIFRVCDSKVVSFLKDDYLFCFRERIDVALNIHESHAPCDHQQVRNLWRFVPPPSFNFESYP
jgi:hypothetical protein